MQGENLLILSLWNKIIPKGNIFMYNTMKTFVQLIFLLKLQRFLFFKYVTLLE